MPYILENLGIKPINKNSYIAAAKDVVLCFQTEFGSKSFCKSIRIFRNQTLFHAVEMMAIPEELPKSWKNDVLLRLKSRGYRIQGPVFSFEYKGAQIDITSIPKISPKLADLALGYPALAKIIGRSLAIAGYRLDLDYLRRQITEDGKSHIREQITNDRQKILETIDLSHQQWLEGFDTSKQGFEYLLQSQFFQKIDLHPNSPSKTTRDFCAMRRSMGFTQDGHEEITKTYAAKLLELARNKTGEAIGAPGKNPKGQKKANAVEN